MRIVDLILGALGVTALGLMLTGAPLLEAADTHADPSSQFIGSDSRAIGSDSRGMQQDLGSVTGQGQAEKTRATAQPENDGALRCCLGRPLTPAERAARARTLQRVLTPSGNSSQAGFDRLRVDLLLQGEDDLTAAEEREIS